MKQRREQRIAKALQVKARGVDRNGNSFVQKIHTIDISRNGARLGSMGCVRGPGETIEVSRGWQKARFRVVWVGEIGRPQDNQIGITSLEPGKYIWGVTIPPAKPETYTTPQTEAAKAEVGMRQVSLPHTLAGGERRQEVAVERRPSRRRSVRVPLQIPITVRWVAGDGTLQEHQTMTMAINEHGCLVPLKAPVIEGVTLEVTNRSSNEASKGKAVWCGGTSPQGDNQVAIELERAGSEFWGRQYAERARFPDIQDTWVG
jgi:hypothetical protein